MKPGGSIVKVKEGNRAREGGRERRKDLVMIREPRRVAKGKEKREIDLLRDRLQQALWTIIVKGIPSFLRPPSSIVHLLSFFRFLFSGHVDFHSDFHTQQSFIRKCPFNVPLPCPWPVASAARILLLLEPLLPPLCPRKRISPFSISIGVVLSCKLSICCR